MKPEKPPFDSIGEDTDPQNYHYDQKLLQTQEKCLPLLERLVVKFSEYKKICTALKEKRPSLEWLTKLEATCEKIEKKMTAQFFEKLDKAERESRNTFGSSEDVHTETVIENKTEKSTISQKFSRWDVKPEKDIDQEERSIKEKCGSKCCEKMSLKQFSTYNNRHPFKRSMTVIDLTKNEETDECSYSQRTYKSYLREEKEQDLDVEIIASTAGLNPLKRTRSQTQFATLEEVNKSPFYKRFTSDNMTFDSRTANLKYGTVYDLVKSKAHSTESHHRKYSQQRCEVPRRSNESKEYWSHRRDFGSINCNIDSYGKKTSLSCNKSHKIHDRNYERLKIDVKFFDRNKESHISNNSRRLDESSSKAKCGKSGNEFQGKMPYYKQSTPGNLLYSCSEKSFEAQTPKDPVTLTTPDLHPVPNQTFPSSQRVTNPQFNEVGYPQQSCSFHCNCYNNTPYFSGMGASYQPTMACAVGSNNYAFFPGQYFPNQPVISSQNKNLPTPFPTFSLSNLTVPTLSNATLEASTSYNSVNKSGYSVPVFYNEENTRVNKASPTLMTWNTRNNEPEITCRIVKDNTSRPKDPRTDLMKDRFSQSTSNLTQGFNTVDTVFSQTPCFSGISEERFSQSCTFLRPDNLYKDFRCHSVKNNDNSFETLKSFGPANNTPPNSPNKIDLPNKPTLPNLKNMLTRDISLKKAGSGNNNCNENTLNHHSLTLKDKNEVTPNRQDIKTLKPKDDYISPLSNLYNDSPTSESEGYNNLTNKLLENRKRKYQVLGRNSCETEKNRKKISKVEAMNKEGQSYKVNTNSENILRNQGELADCSRVENSSKSDDTNLWGKIKSPTEWIEKDCHINDLQISTNIIQSNPSNDTHEELHSEKILNLKKKENTILNEVSVGKEKLSQTSNSLKESKEQKTKLHVSLTNISKTTKNSNELKKQRPADKCSNEQKLKNTSFTKLDTKKEQEKVLCCQEERLDCIGNEVEKVGSKNFERNPRSNSSSGQLLKPDGSAPKNVISVTKERLPEIDSTSNKSMHIKKKIKCTQKQPPEKSTDQAEICLEDCDSFNRLPTSKNKESKFSKSLKENPSCTKEKGSDKKSSEYKNKDKDKIHRSKKLGEQEKSSEKATSAFNKGSESLKIPTPQKNKISSDADSIACRHKKPAKIIKSSSMLEKHDLKTDTPSKIISQCTLSIPEEKIGQTKSLKKRNNNKTKDCCVVLEREISVAKDKSSTIKTCGKTLAPSVKVNTFSGKIKSHNTEKPEKSTDAQMPTVNNQRNIEKGVTGKNQQMLIEETILSSNDMPNSDNDKVKDLVLRMKSLSQSEALKVISAFASTLKIPNSEENISNSKDQRFPSNGEDTKKTPIETKIKNEIIDDYPELLKYENHQEMTTKSNVYTSGSAGKNINETSHPLKTNEISKTTNKPKSSEDAINISNSLSGVSNHYTLLKPVFDMHPEKSTRKLVDDKSSHKEVEKCKHKKKKKLSELDKIHADLESYHGLDDIMKCSGLRACRLKNEQHGPLRGSLFEENQTTKISGTVSAEEPFFIQDEITIKMEPIPELTYDLIKQEPDYF